MTTETDATAILHFKFASIFWKREEINLLEAKVPVIATQILYLAERSNIVQYFLKRVTVSYLHYFL